MRKFFLVFIFLIVLAVPLVGVHAQLSGALDNLNKAVGPGSNTGLQSDLATSIGTVIKGLLSLVGTIFLILTIYAGILWMTAQGDEGKIDKAKDIIRASIIGLVITLSAYAITYFVTNKLSGAAGSGAGGGTKFTPQSECSTKVVTNDCVKAKCYWVDKLPAGETVHCKSFE